MADPYAAARRAVTESGDWPPVPLAGKRVVVKPNLVMGLGAHTGTTTDPGVTRALVDLALEAGAAEVLLVEGGNPRAFFAECGYDFFRNYGPQRRVRLVDLNDVPVTFAPVPNGLAYRHLYMPSLLLDPDVVFISAAKLKTHVGAKVTLSLKNLFGLPPFKYYFERGQFDFRPRFKLHTPGSQQTIVDLHLVRPVDFAVVDGIWGMEGPGPAPGPAGGTPVKTDWVIAGRNAVAVDRICLHAMGIPQDGAQHVTLASERLLGPAGLGDIELRGDALVPRAFRVVVNPPFVWPPAASPQTFRPGAGQHTTLAYRTDVECETRVSIYRPFDGWAETPEVRLLQDWTLLPAGTHEVSWNGRDDRGRVVHPAEYKAWVQARYAGLPGTGVASGWVSVAS
jgi:uncharacterized protein (DUF362 family)